MIPEFSNILGEWLKGTGPESDIVASTRIRLARNIAGIPFLQTADESKRREIIQVVEHAVRAANVSRNILTFNMDDVPNRLRDVLVERHLISRELASGSGPRAAICGRSEMLSIMVNEEDHLRLQWIKSGFDADRAWSAIRKIDTAIESQLPYAFSDRYGYLTACPTNVGTGMRVSVMMHLPALTMRDHVEKAVKAAQRMNHVVRGLYGEGTKAFGDFYQISNQTTLGRSEEEIVDGVQEVVHSILEYERKMRAELYMNERSLIEDRVMRALAILKSARRLNVQEMMTQLSMVRLGIGVGIVRDVAATTLNEIFLMGQPAHIQHSKDRDIAPDERDEIRANMVRARLSAMEN